MQNKKIKVLGARKNQTPLYIINKQLLPKQLTPGLKIHKWKQHQTKKQIKTQKNPHQTTKIEKKKKRKLAKSKHNEGIQPK